MPPAGLPLEASMSTPSPQDSKLDGLELYAPRRAATRSAPAGQDSRSQMLPRAADTDRLRAEENDQRRAADTEPANAAEAPINDPIEAATDHDRSFRQPRAAVASLPPALNLRLPQREAPNGPPSAPESPRRDRRFTEVGTPPLPPLIQKSCPSRRWACGTARSLPCWSDSR